MSDQVEYAVMCYGDNNGKQMNYFQKMIVKCRILRAEIVVAATICGNTVFGIFFMNFLNKASFIRSSSQICSRPARSGCCTSLSGPKVSIPTVVELNGADSTGIIFLPMP